MVEEMIPIVALIVIGVVIGLSFYFRHKTRQELQMTVRAAIDKGQELTPEVLEGLADSLNSKFGDLRRGVIAIAIGIAFFLFGFLLGQEEAEKPLMAISTFPFLIGIGYMGLWFYTRRKET